MSAENKVPGIRFQGFSGELNRISLNNATSVFRSGKFLKAEDIKKQDIYPVYGGNGLRGYTADYNHNGTYALIGRQGALCGNMNLSHGKAFFTEHAIAVQANQENDTVFLYYKLGLMDLGQYSGQSAQPGLAVNKLIELEISAPVKSEQSAIGNYFQKLDRLINQHQQKHDKLSNLKKAMLEKMFPKPGKTTPEIRFKGFGGEWEEKELGSDIADIVGGGTPSTAIAEYWDGDIDWYSPTEIGKSVYAAGSQKKITALGLKNSSAKVLPAGNTVLFTSRAGIGDMAILAKSGCTNQGFQSFVIKDGYSPYFIYSAGKQITAFALERASGSTFLEISGKQLGKMKLLVPCEAEQTTIGNYFQKLDQLINQHQEQISKLNNIKQACLSKMFV